MPDLFPSNAGVVSYVGECSSSTYLCGRCEGNCNTDDDCKGDLKCKQRDRFNSVSGCFLAGGDSDMRGKNVCFDDDSDKPELRPCHIFDHRNGRCPECTTCHNDNDCRGNLRCAIRSGK